MHIDEVIGAKHGQRDGMDGRKDGGRVGMSGRRKKWNGWKKEGMEWMERKRDSRNE